MAQEVVLAVDIGGTKISAGLVDAQGQVYRHAEVATPIPGSLLNDALRGLLTSVVDTTAPRAVGLACAGPVDPPRGTVSPVNIPAWRDFPLIDLVRDIVPGAPVDLVGDAIAAALGEHWLGAGQGIASMLGIVVSTGVGGGLVLNGVAYAGPSGNAGHIGHVVVDPAGPQCTCGATGCVEAYASGPSMVRWAREQGWTGPDARALAADAARGEAVAVAAFDRGARALARGIVGTATLCDVDRVVIGGGVAAAGPVLFEPLRKHLADSTTLDFVRRVTVKPSTLGRHGGLLGAARTALLAPVVDTASRP
ncbi:ROK family protein [Streptomyces sp. NBC_00873]|uniref:ROK family protein n=1 Tax=unclassified Streptomyces TaxID=2593676 RepID=UPI00225014FB|nr:MULTISPECIES: ROK family protein [unclassified Streptomyces]WSY89669.1 ROK family protein [Streptomyces sp. NBC_00873]WTA41344.1 ROK family protein [Streptomyces sp. NBC_00842]MCX4538377.1 ROK family protein [Streptomyces sp. NBC_01669]WSA05808.1 ROK family protein [Streptomyces sp. NBC_00841]WSY96883.1 ROK family protein [Streptomyces sp. NBC_00873]